MAPQAWEMKSFTTSGVMLERWCLKTLITIAFDGPAPIGNGDTGPGKVPCTLVRKAFGLEAFPPPRAGLYWMGEVGDSIDVSEGIVITTFSNQIGRLGGARFRFWGLTLLLVLDDGPAGPFSFKSVSGDQDIQANALRHPRSLGMGVHGQNSHSLDFLW
jgi:hypothetical protein